MTAFVNRVTRALRRGLLGCLPLGVLALLAAWPLVRYGPPLLANAITDGPNHLYRFVLLDWHIQHGDLYPRWFSDLHFGFGAPVLNFYAPLSYYILVLLHLVVPSYPGVFALGFSAALAAAIGGMYLWGRDQFGSPVAGLTAAAAYVLTPYLYYSVLDRAAYPEVWGLALAPWIFWLVWRCLCRPSAWTGPALAVAYAALLLTHNLPALFFSPLFLVYSLATFRDTEQRSPWALVTLGGRALQGVGLAPGTLTLYWQSLQAVPERLTVFVHRFDAQGVFVAGQDSPPARATTSWLPGEVISDVHPITLDGHFEIGLYDPITGQRFGEPFVAQPTPVP